MNTIKRKIAFLLPTLTYLLAPLLSILLLPQITAMISPGQYGEYNYYLIITNLILMFLIIPSINTASSRFLNKSFLDYEEDKAKISVLLIIVSLVFLIILFLFSFFITHSILFIFVGFSLLLINLINIRKTILRTNGDTVIFSYLNIATLLFQYGFIFAAIVLDKLNVYLLISGALIFNAAYILYYIYTNKHSFIKLFSNLPKDYSKLKKFILPGIGISIYGLLLSQSDRLMIKWLIEDGEKYVGIFSVNYAVYAQSIEIIIALFFLYIPNILYPIYESKKLSSFLTALKLFLKLYIIVAGFVVIFLIFNYAKINALIFHESYFLQSKISIYILSGQFCFGMYRIITNYYAVTNNLKNLNRILMLTTIINILSNLILIPIIGFEAAAITTLASYFFLFVISYLKVTKAGKVKLLDKQDFFLLILILVLLIFIKPAENYEINLKLFIEIFSSFCLIFIAFCLIYGKKMMKIFKEIKSRRII
ncbi:polysaccharide biosynthesis C-terminal domain-containing protein [Planococcus sp. YIM B11945]|uniref:polysaccharide biosynthesis C-terminal domain-containing protein n=1 Tax=Planococcus sp. YIM B11945 TaxID=3435410 RepID=UPI003D7C79F6